VITPVDPVTEAMSKSWSVWTPEDEARLTELIERKRRVHDAGLNRIRDAMAGLPDGFEDLVQFMAENAQVIRDALLPFDGRDKKV